jgi:hypothetical protein
MDAATESAIRFGLPFFSRDRASSTTAAPADAISRGTSIVLLRAASNPSPDRMAARYSRKATESSSISSSARRRSASAFSCAAAAPLHLSDRNATFCSSAADTATTAAAAEPLAGAGSPDAILLKR